MSFLLDARQRTAIFALLMLIAAAGCATVTEQLEKTETWVKSLKSDASEQPAPPQQECEGSPSSSFYTHRVTWTGESLSIVAKWYTGNLENWKVLSKANPEIKPHSLRLGMKIRIPESMIVNRDPLPQEFVTAHYSNDVSKPRSLQNGPEDLPLIGPKSYSDQ